MQSSAANFDPQIMDCGRKKFLDALGICMDVTHGSVYRVSTILLAAKCSLKQHGAS